MKLITRAEAKKKGLKRYFTGKACPHGHLSDRLVGNACCIKCLHLAVRHKLRKDPARAARVRAKTRKNNPMRFLKHSRLWAKYRKQLTIIWRRNNKERYKASCRNYFNKKRGAVGRHSWKDIEKIRKKQRERCLCGISLKNSYHLDHKKPLSRGGSNWPRNLQLLCARCNTSKGAKTMKEWKRARNFA